MYYNAFQNERSRTYGCIKAEEDGRGRYLMKAYMYIHTMSDKELRQCKRALRLRRMRRNRSLVSLLGIWTAFCVVFLCEAAFHSVRINACDGFKYYTSVTVDMGDTLWELADEYIDYAHYKDKNAYIAEIRSINHLNESSDIVEGQRLIFPYYSDVYIR